MKNGRADHDDDEPNDPKITRIEDARRRRQLGLGGSSTSGRKDPPVRSRGSLRDWLIGGVIVAMAVGYLASLIVPMIR